MGESIKSKVSIIAEKLHRNHNIPYISPKGKKESIWQNKKEKNLSIHFNL